MKRGVLIFTAILFAVSALLFWMFTPQELSSTIRDELNSKNSVIEVVELTKPEKRKFTVEDKQRSKEHWERIGRLSEQSIKDIEFYGKVVDQYNSPIPDVLVDYTGSRAVYASGSGPGTTQTDIEGLFEISGARGNSLVINDLTKLGYQINDNQDFTPQNGDSPSPNSWSYYTEENPYIFKAWKIERYPKVAQSSSFAGFEPGVIYTLDFLKKEKVKQDLLEGDIKVIFKQQDDAWQLELSAIDGGMQIAEGEYLNRAPDSGYQAKMLYSGDRKNRYMKKILYFTSRNQSVYGLMKLGIYGYYRDASAIKIEYVVNLEQGKNLTVKVD